MPNIIVEAGTLTKDKKIELIKILTEKASEITIIPESSYSVLIKEFPVENWGVGGISLEEIKRKMIQN